MDEEGRTPLFHAMAARHYDLARRWLEAGANPDHLDHEGFAVIHDLAKRDEVEPVELLQRHGADLDLGTGLGFTPALLALRYPLSGEDVWGATARILRTFSRVMRCALSPRPEAPGPTRAEEDRAS